MLLQKRTLGLQSLKTCFTTKENQRGWKTTGGALCFKYNSFFF